MNTEPGWTIAEGKTETYPFQLRFRTFPADFPRSNYPIRLNVFWAMSQPSSSGLASPDDIKLMHAFEDRIVGAAEIDGSAVLAMVLTGRGEREFVFFAHSSKEFLLRLSQMPQERSRYPIKIHANDDSSWSYFDNEVRNVQ